MQKSQPKSAIPNTLSCLCMGVLGVFVTFSHGGLIATKEKAASFFGGAPAKAVYGAGTNINFVDFSASPLAEKTIVTGTSGGNLQISPDGSRFAYVLSGKIYIGKIEENTKVKIEIGTGMNPNWWIHPTTKKEYVLYQVGYEPSSTTGIYMREIGADGNPVGQAKRLVEQPLANAGRSPDGGILANNDNDKKGNGHGMYIIDPPLAMENAAIKYWIYVSATGWWANGPEWAGYCNGAISSAPIGHSLHGALVHMGSGHTSIYIRKPQGYENKPTEVIQDDQGPTLGLKAIIDRTDPVINLASPKSLGADGKDDHWGYSDWSTHPNFISATGGTSSKSSGNKNGYFVNLTKKKGEADFVLKFASSNVAEPDLWVGGQSSTGMGSEGVPEALAPGRDGSLRLHRLPGGAWMVTTSWTGTYSVEVRDVEGRLRHSSHGQGPGRHALDKSDLASGINIVTVSNGTKTTSLPLLRD